MQIPAQTLPSSVVAALQRGQTMTAIRLLRQATGLDLKAARAQVDRYRQQHPGAAGVAQAARLAVGTARLSPGEVPRRPAWAWLLACLVAVGTVAAGWLAIGR